MTTVHPIVIIAFLGTVVLAVIIGIWIGYEEGIRSNEKKKDTINSFGDGEFRCEDEYVFSLEEVLRRSPRCGRKTEEVQSDICTK